MKFGLPETLQLTRYQPTLSYNTGIYNDEHLLGTPDKRLDELDWQERFADSLSLSDEGTPEHSRQISPASVLPTITTPPIKVLQLFLIDLESVTAVCYSFST